ncbi:MarR family winged helix-turn-helix transcriptional regulator [Deinococcus maricopensis]|uniref:Transcriptional regulator, MarR family n=1 Tax=Deinococcus maricopensis (strain DSM 21211 / LMG 22137 / NRRL B-23946 / LB-34) TaxID=709986 RepID=E8U5I6_DEIML|nr:MarR family transcriptional regulator [Deinococcus maricopensis]ADV66325.1 transcriptional regulator, MarR family [Deinococcus maricopensis DSM 21211]
MTTRKLPSDTPSQHLEDQLCLDLYVASRAIIGAYRPYLHPHDLTYPQYLVLLTLWDHGPQSLKALSARLTLDAGTLSPLLKRLEGRGYITRARAPHDDRALAITLTPTGEALKATLADVPHQVACMTGLSPRQWRDLRVALQALTVSLGTTDNAPPDDPQ